MKIKLSITISEELRRAIDELSTNRSQFLEAAAWDNTLLLKIRPGLKPPG